jgi:hypothetical protein
MSKCLVVDHGIFTSFAERLAEDHEVAYFVPYAERGAGGGYVEDD